MSVKIATVTTLNPITGKVSEQDIVKRHPSVSKKEDSKMQKKENIIERGQVDSMIAATKPAVNTSVHPMTDVGFADYKTVKDIVRKSDWIVHGKFTQIDNNVRHAYLVVYRWIDDINAKNGKRKEVNFIDIDERGNFQPVGNLTIKQALDKVALLSEDDFDAGSYDPSMRESQAIKRSKPLLRLFGTPAPVAPPVIDRDYVVQRIHDGKLYKSGEFIPVADLDIAQRMTKNSAFNMARKIREIAVKANPHVGDYVRYIHADNIFDRVLPAIADIVPTFTETITAITDVTKNGILPVAPAVVLAPYVADVPSPDSYVADLDDETKLDLEAVAMA